MAILLVSTLWLRCQILPHLLRARLRWDAPARLADYGGEYATRGSRRRPREKSMSKSCTHLKSVHTSTPNSDGCEECLAMGDTWVHLRLCRTCGHVGCCDDSKNTHATKHFHATRHPIITSLEPGEDWSWCYIDEVAMELE
jgi:hypothetical protein